jgi:molybdopterin molybdotransferase
MISYEQALETVLENVHVLRPERRPILESTGQVAAQDVLSDIDLPPADIAGPDGYAVRSSDLLTAGRDTPVALSIIGTARAGRSTKRTVRPGTAIRIMTGSLVPEGADCVVPFEDTDEPEDKNGPNRENPSTVSVFSAVERGTGIRRAGSNVKTGTVAVLRGTVLGPAQISALLSIGQTRVTVIRRPVVTIIATGDELVDPGKQLSPGKTYNSNAAAIASLVIHYGGIPRILGVARDNEESVLEKFGKGLHSDAIITSGGISHGDFDLVRLTLGRIGRTLFSRINMGPGAGAVFGLINRPPVRGRNGEVPVFALSGSPAGCLINFETLVRPALLKMQGLARLSHPCVEATAANSAVNSKGMPCVRWTYLEENDGKYRAVINAGGNKANLTSIAMANSLTILPRESTVKAGDAVTVLPLDWGRYRFGAHT